MIIGTKGIGNLKYISSLLINNLFIRLPANIALLIGRFQILENF